MNNQQTPIVAVAVIMFLGFLGLGALQLTTNSELKVLTNRILALESEGAIMVPNNDCEKQLTVEGVQFSYPCHWLTNVTGGHSWSAQGTIVSPDGKASFHFPAPDIDLLSATNLKNDTILLNRASYQTRSFQIKNEYFLQIMTQKDLHANGYDLLVVYQDEKDKEVLVKILESITMVSARTHEKMIYDYDFDFEYPKSYIVEELKEDTINILRITNKAGTLTYAMDGSFEKGEFADGIQIDIVKTNEPSLSPLTKKETSNPRVTEVAWDCDGDGCPMRVYYVKTGTTYTHQIKMRYNRDFMNVERVIADFIHSIK